MAVIELSSTQAITFASAATTSIRLVMPLWKNVESPTQPRGLRVSPCISSAFARPIMLLMPAPMHMVASSAFSGAFMPRV